MVTHVVLHKNINALKKGYKCYLVKGLTAIFKIKFDFEYVFEFH